MHEKSLTTDKKKMHMPQVGQYTQAHCAKPCHTHTHTQAHTGPLRKTLPHTHTHTHTHTAQPSHTHTHTHTGPLGKTLLHTHILSVSLTFTLCCLTFVH